MPARKGKGGGKGGGAHGGAHGRARATAVDKQTKPVCGSGPWQPPSFQLHSAAAGQGPLGYDDANPEWQANTLYRSGLPADRKEAEALLRAAGLWEQRQEKLAIGRGRQLERYRCMGAEGYAANLRKGADTGGSRAHFHRAGPELVPELDEQLRNMAEGLEPFKDAEGKAIALYRTGQPADHATADAILEAAGLLHGRQADLGAQRGLQLGHYRRMGAQGYAAFLQRGAGTDGSRAHSEQNYPELLQELDAQLRRIAEGLPPYPEEAAAEAAPAAELGVRPPQPPAAAVSSP
eukprot:TRINITY_DN1988_c0_g1_i8.p1 TRINITY_DN1988_c0_g1~~TRINITY_DN1988_c0_g1_i8.p1  ORF type:complete len:292 (+),score=64.31 TRINITY_DN1988_c0_g1_i8:99-974(+)